MSAKIEDFGEIILGAKKHLSKVQDDIEKGKIPTLNPTTLKEAGLSILQISIAMILRKQRTGKYEKRNSLRTISEIINGEMTEEEAETYYRYNLNDKHRTYPSVSFVRSLHIEDIEIFSTMVLHTMRPGFRMMLYKISRERLQGEEKLYVLTNEEVDALFHKYLEKAKKEKSSAKPKGKSKKALNIYFQEKGGKTTIDHFLPSGKYLTLMEFNSYAEAENFLRGDNRENNLDILRDILAKITAQPIIRRGESQPRIGEDVREGDVTPEMFHEEYSFRGVQFGNWVNQKERQASINKAYDALADLGKVVGITGKALSLNQKLALAFGARGKGGANAGMAHYEPTRNVINLTKKKGAGALAHEWFHALDMLIGTAGSHDSDFFSEAMWKRKEYNDALTP